MRILLVLIVLSGLNVRVIGQDIATETKFGVLKTTPQVSPGYVLVSPLSARRSFLLDNDGRVVHVWKADRKPGQASYLLEDGSLLRAGKVDEFFQFPSTTGSGGRIQKFNWDGDLIWDFVSSSPYRMSHHDLEPMPNGNVLCIVWESYTREVAEQAGRAPDRLVGDVLWFDAVFELKPTGLNTADVVWKWSVRDHVVQDFDESKDNYGDPADHPELVDINFMLRPVADWVHMNSVDYNPDLDQIMVCSRSLSEFWIIDHSTTTEEARGHTGGRYGRGGDLLYRWGNPVVYRQGTPKDRKLYNPHDAHWIPKGLPGAGHVLIFNNGLPNTDEDFSSADEIALPLNDDGTYARDDDSAYGPTELTWTFEDPGKLFSPRISSAQRLPNGNTLICSGTQHLLLEVTQDAKIAWIYRNPPRFQKPTEADGEIAPESEVAPADLPEDQREALRIANGIPLEDGGTMFKAVRYPVDYPAFQNRNLSPKTVAAE
ncbi:MAG: aryl-sulfate sulfotransferase [Planctomycetaceae bacterium]